MNLLLVIGFYGLKFLTSENVVVLTICCLGLGEGSFN